MSKLIKGDPEMRNKATFPIDDPAPICTTEGCDRPRVVMAWLPAGKKTATHARYRPICRICHETRTASKHGCKTITEVVAKNAGFDSVQEYMLHLANKAGFRSLTEYRNSKHPYLKYRKNYCENIDGRLGFKCTAVFPTEDELYAMGIDYGVMPHLDTDHINGDPTSHLTLGAAAMQTLCKCCHSFKTNIQGDSKTPGRKTLITEAT